MNKTIETINFEAEPELVNRIDKLFSDLSTYNDRITAADIYLKLRKEKAENEKEVEIKVFLPGHELFADAEGNSFEEAANKVFSKMKRQLIEVKEKQRNHH